MSESEVSETEAEADPIVTTLKIDDRGRGTVDIDVRRELGIDDCSRSLVEVEVRRVISRRDSGAD